MTGIDRADEGYSSDGVVSVGTYMDKEGLPQSVADYEYLAAMHPEQTLELIAEVRRLRARLAINGGASCV